MPTKTATASETSSNGRDLTKDEEKWIAILREQTEKAWALKQAYSQCARDRRDAINALRLKKWSFRRIGETIGVSGQRIDSMIRLGEKLAAEEAAGKAKD